MPFTAAETRVSPSCEYGCSIFHAFTGYGIQLDTHKSTRTLHAQVFSGGRKKIITPLVFEPVCFAKKKKKEMTPQIKSSFFWGGWEVKKPACKALAARSPVLRRIMDDVSDATLSQVCVQTLGDHMDMALQLLYGSPVASHRIIIPLIFGP